MTIPGVFHRFVERLPRDFIDLMERSRLNIERGEVTGLSHAVEWVEREASRFPKDYSRRGFLTLGLVVPCAAALWWPRYAHGAFAGAALYPAHTPGPTVQMAAPTGTPATDEASLTNAFTSLPASGGTIVMQPGTYVWNSKIQINDRNKFRLTGSTGITTIQAHANFPTATGDHVLVFANCDDFVLDNFVVDGNRTARGLGGNNAAFLQRSNLHFHECQRAALIKITSKESCGDGFEFTGHEIHGITLSRHCYDILMYDCIADHALRNGLAIIAAHNFQVLGGEYKNTNGANPRAGIDIEPDDLTARPSDEHILMRGVTFSGNPRGISISGVTNSTTPLEVNTFDVTVEGCDFSGGATFVDPIQRGFGIHLLAARVRVQNNLFRDFGTIYNDLDGCLVIPGNDLLTTIEMTGNCFNNLTTTKPAHFVRTGSGTGHSITNERGHNVAGTFVSNSNPSGCSTSGNNGAFGAPQFPTPAAPNPVSVGQDCP